MRRWYAAALLLLVAPATNAQDAPEQLLPVGTQLYVRWDGVAAHVPSYSKTALGKMMMGDTGVFVASVYKQIQEGLGSVLTVEQLLRGEAPETLQARQADVTEAGKLLGVLAANGFVLGVEVRSFDPPDIQSYLVLPNAGADPKPVIGALRLAVTMARGKIGEKKVGDTTLYFVSDPAPVHLCWFVAGKHAVVSFGTDEPEKVFKDVTNSPGKRLVDSPLFKRVKEFNKFETSARLFLDLESLVRMGSAVNKDLAKLLDDLGLTGVKSAVFYSGFENEAESGLLELDVPGPRKGLLSLLASKPFTLADVPPLPPDVVSWSMTNFELSKLYNLAFQTAEQIAGIVAPDAIREIKEIRNKINAALGIDLYKDLLASLDDKVVLYSSPSEGPLSLGMVVMIKVKDEAQLRKALEGLVKGIAKQTNTEVTLKKRSYRGVELREVRVKQQGFFFVPTYAIHKGWLVVSLFPQPVHGYILRANGEMAAWKPSPGVQASFDKLGKEFIAVTYSDPRPGLKTLWSIAPAVGGLINSLSPELNFEVGHLPNAQEATRHLFPNVAVTVDDGKAIRTEIRSSLMLPIDVAGIDNYAIVLFLGSLARFF